MDTAPATNPPSRGAPSARSRGRGGRFGGGFRGRGGPRGFSDREFNNLPVPSIQQVFPGAPVSIVLKVDQPTGREVQGIVSSVLTGGNHPRGIKVMLQDGRVGRVQRMVSEETAKAGSEGLSGLGENGEGGGGSRVMAAPAAAVTAGSGGRFSGPRYSDFRVDSPDEPPASMLSLEDYVVVKTKGKKGKKSGKKNQVEDEAVEDLTAGISSMSTTPTTISKCPVCGDFEGDEAAVAHHVNEHFE